MELHYEEEGVGLLSEAGHVARMIAWEVQLLEVWEGPLQLPQVVRPPKQQGVHLDEVEASEVPERLEGGVQDVAVVEVGLLLPVKHMHLLLIQGGSRILCYVDIDWI